MISHFVQDRPKKWNLYLKYVLFSHILQLTKQLYLLLQLNLIKNLFLSIIYVSRHYIAVRKIIKH